MALRRGKPWWVQRSALWRKLRKPTSVKRTAVIDTGYNIAKGPAIQPEERWMLHTDSGLSTIDAFDLDVERGRATNRRVRKVLAAADDYPDGRFFRPDSTAAASDEDAGVVQRALLDQIDRPADTKWPKPHAGDRQRMAQAHSGGKSGFTGADWPARPMLPPAYCRPCA